MSEPNDSPGQRDASPEHESVPTSETTVSEPEPETKKSPVAAEIIEQSRKFLKNDQVKDASTESKIAFLEHKGLTSEEIESAMNNTDETGTSSTTVSPQESTAKSTRVEEIHTSAKSNLQPPVITYPEFLTNPPPTQAPILTTKSLLTTVYLTSLLTATLHGTHSYAQSMLEKLGDSRHELFSTALSKLEILSSKLESVVSEKPQIKKLTNDKSAESKDGKCNQEPTELFHRDIGIQTSPPPTRSDFSPLQSVQTPLVHQSSRLAAIHSNLEDISGCLTSEAKSDAELENKVSELCSYLNTLAYPLPSLIGYGNMYHGNGPSKNEVIDKAAEIKREIKGMKGLLLSARSFPGAVGIKPGAVAK
ncbi:hypothetical protein K3495_g2893 [Podosphaera aphanis]|nr:hypothetical protein K3495_g2893 [Podosphaera aphanis]